MVDYFEKDAKFHSTMTSIPSIHTCRCSVHFKNGNNTFYPLSYNLVQGLPLYHKTLILITKIKISLLHLTKFHLSTCYYARPIELLGNTGNFSTFCGVCVTWLYIRGSTVKVVYFRACNFFALQRVLTFSLVFKFAFFSHPT